MVARTMKAFDDASRCQNPDEICQMIREYNLTWEHLPTEMLNESRVWQALLGNMPVEALIRNLGRMTSLGVFPVNSEEEEIVINKIRNMNTGTPELHGIDSDEMLPNRSGVHPSKILITLVNYKVGRGDRGHLNWTPNQRIIEALNSAFYGAFSSVPPTGKKFFLGIDVSASMSQPVLGSRHLTCAMAAAAMLMTVVRTEQEYEIRAFTENSRDLLDLNINPEDSLNEVMEKTRRTDDGRTDCAAPMKYAIEKHIKDIDVFIVYTANETWYGNVHPAEALRAYREYVQKPSVKLIVCAMCSNKFSIADPKDGRMFDLPGFDPSTPYLIADIATH